MTSRDRAPVVRDLDERRHEVGVDVVGVVVVLVVVPPGPSVICRSKNARIRPMSVCVRASNRALRGAGRPVVDVGVERLAEERAEPFVAVDIVRFNTHPAADPEAGVRSRYVVEARTESIADPHVFDRLSGRKVGGLRPGAGGQDCRGAERRLLSFILDLQSKLLEPGFPFRLGNLPPNSGPPAPRAARMNSGRQWLPETTLSIRSRRATSDAFPPHPFQIHVAELPRKPRGGGQCMNRLLTADLPRPSTLGTKRQPDRPNAPMIIRIARTGHGAPAGRFCRRWLRASSEQASTGRRERPARGLAQARRSI